VRIQLENGCVPTGFKNIDELNNVLEVTATSGDEHIMNREEVH